MKKSIRVLSVPSNIIKKIESHNIFSIDELIKTMSIPNSLELESEESRLLIMALDNYKIIQLNNELVGYKQYDKYSYLNSKFKLEDFGFSIRIMNGLESQNINTVSKLLLKIEQLEIYNIENLGAKSLLQVLETIEKFVIENNLDIKIYSPSLTIDEVSIHSMGFNKSAITSLENLNILNIGDIRKKYLNGQLASMFNTKTLNVILDHFKKYLLIKPDSNYYFLKIHLIENRFGEVTFNQLQKYINKNDLDVDFDQLIEDLSSRNDIIVSNEKIRLPKFIEKIKTIALKKESEEILLSRFSGKTLQEVADEFGKTRERIRQIVRDRMVNITMIYEEAFVKEYNKFPWHDEVFMKLFNLDNISFNIVKYLGKKPEGINVFPKQYVKQLIEEEIIKGVSIEEIKGSLPLIFPPQIEIYGVKKDKLNKREFLEYVIEHFVPDKGLHKSKIVKLANKVALENNLEYHFDVFIDIVTNTVQGLQNTRYYDYLRIDEKALNKFKDILYSVDSVYSCTYFYLKHLDFMKEYDIRDGYELHFILRKYFLKSEEFLNLIEFNRQPMIAKRGMQFSDVVLQHWKELNQPVQIDEFADRLIQLYGYHKGTLINVINSTLSNYISLRTIYNFESKVDMQVLERIKHIMVDDFYEINSLTNKLKSHGINHNDYYYFSNSWLDELGYKTHDINYIIKKEFSSLKHVFYSKLDGVDSYQITKKDHEMRETTLILFIENLREEYKAFLIKDNILVTMNYLEKQGLLKDDIKKYVNELKNYIPSNTYFTHHSLLKENYQEAHAIFKKIESFNLGKDLIVNFIRNIPGIKKTTKGNLFRISSKPTTITEFVDDISRKINSNDPKVLRQYIRINYGINIRNLKK